MYDLKEVQKFYNEVLEECKNVIPYSEKINYQIKLNRCKTSLGKCRRMRVLKTLDLFEITLSKYILNCTEKEIKQTLIHELIHTCKDCFNHSREFKGYAYRIKDKLGYDIKISGSYTGFKNAVNKEMTQIKCKKCGYIFNVYRKLKYNITDYHCSICHGGLEYV